MSGWLMATIQKPGEEADAEMIVVNPRGSHVVLSLDDGTEIEMDRAELQERLGDLEGFEDLKGAA